MNLTCKRQPHPSHFNAWQARSTLAVIALACLSLAGCASKPPPVAEMAVSNAAVAQAANAGAAEYAPAELSAARDKLARANVAIAAKDQTTARWLADEALVDARLAEAKSEASRARKSAEALQTSTRVLREEMSRQLK